MSETARGWDFSGSKAASEIELTMPGSIGIFDVTKVEFGESKTKQTPFMKLTFTSETLKNEQGTLESIKTSFNHSFYISGGAMDRIQYLHKVIHDVEMPLEFITQESLTARFNNKKLALKVTGQVGDNGKGYPNLGYAGFAKKPIAIDELKFGPKERLEIEAAMKAIVEGGIDKSDKEQNTGQGQAPAAAGGGF